MNQHALLAHLIIVSALASPIAAKNPAKYIYPELDTATICFVSPFYDSQNADDKYYSWVFSIELQKAAMAKNMRMTKISPYFDTLLFSHYSDPDRARYFLNLPDTVRKAGIDYLLFIYRIAFIKSTKSLGNTAGAFASPGGGFSTLPAFSENDKLSPVNRFENMSFKFCLMNLHNGKPVCIDSISTKMSSYSAEARDAMEKAIILLVNKLLKNKISRL